MLHRSLADGTGPTADTLREVLRLTTPGAPRGGTPCARSAPSATAHRSRPRSWHHGPAAALRGTDPRTLPGRTADGASPFTTAGATPFLLPSLIDPPAQDAAHALHLDDVLSALRRTFRTLDPGNHDG